MIQARMMVGDVQHGNGWDEIRLYPVYSTDPADPNYSYSQSSPGGELRLTITRSKLVGTIQKGQVYLVNLQPEKTSGPLPVITRLPMPDLAPLPTPESVKRNP